MFRRSAAALAISALAFAGVAADGGSGATVAVDGVTAAVVDGVLTVSGTPSFGGGEPVVITEDGVDGSPGFDIVSATLFQEEDVLVATMEISGAFAPGAQYNFPLGATGQGDNQLLAYANSTADFAFQLANFDDGYASTEIQGEVNGSTITWFLPLSVLGVSGGDRVNMGAEPLNTALGVSAGGNSLNFGCCIEIDTADWMADTFHLGGGMIVEVLGGDVEETQTAKVRRGVASAVFKDLPAGTYEVLVTSKFLDAVFEQTLTVTV